MRRSLATWTVLVTWAIPSSVMAFFPPVRTAQVVSPSVTIQGEPEPVKPPTVAATPEPATLVTALIGLSLLAVYHYRRPKLAV
jgi:hypothetical protein